MLALALPLLLVAVINFTLYLLDAGHDTRLILPAGAADPSRYRVNNDASYAYYQGQDLAGPEPRLFTHPKPPGTYRVAVVGESAVEGFPYVTELAFARNLELLLSRQLPKTKIEVFNAGIVGISSFALVDVVRQILASQPDLVVVYAGHNEFYGPGGVGSTATWLAPGTYPMLIEMRRFRLFQWFSSLVARPAENRPLIETLVADLAIPLDGPAFRSAERYYGENLAAIAELVEANGGAVLLCGVACNLRDLSPMASLGDEGLPTAERQRRDDLLRQGQQLLDSGNPGEARQRVEQAAELDPRYALVEYRRAQCLEALSERSAAAAAYQRACDLDGCRFRAPSSFRGIARRIARAPGRTRASYVDVAAKLAEDSAFAAPGTDFFVEHVHFHRLGHRHVALVLGQAIVEDVLRRRWDPELVPTPEEQDQLLDATIFDDLIAYGFAASIYSSQPLNLSPDHPRHRQVIADRLQQLLEATPPDDRRMFVQLDDILRYTDLINALGAALLARGEDRRAWEMFERGKRRRPWQIASYVGAAKALNRLREPQQALDNIQQALAIAPRDPDLQQLQKELTRILRAPKQSPPADAPAK